MFKQQFSMNSACSVAARLFSLVQFLSPKHGTGDHDLTGFVWGRMALKMPKAIELVLPDSCQFVGSWPLQIYRLHTDIQTAELYEPAETGGWSLECPRSHSENVPVQKFLVASGLQAL